MDNVVEVAQEVDRRLATWCSCCGEQCKSVADSFSYPGTHCNYGLGGTYYTGTYSSDCCGADLLNEEPENS